MCPRLCPHPQRRDVLSMQSERTGWRAPRLVRNLLQRRLRRVRRPQPQLVTRDGGIAFSGTFQHEGQKKQKGKHEHTREPTKVSWTRLVTDLAPHRMGSSQTPARSSLSFFRRTRLQAKNHGIARMLPESTARTSGRRDTWLIFGRNLRSWAGRSSRYIPWCRRTLMDGQRRSSRDAWWIHNANVWNPPGPT